MDIASGLIMGIVYAATPGPLNVETIRRGMNGGFLDSLAIQTGSAVGRILYALLALFGAGILLEGATLQLALGVFGVTVLLYMGIKTIREGHGQNIQSSQAIGPADSAPRAFWAGALLSLANPLAVVFWLSIGGRVVYDPGLDGVSFLSGFFIGCILTSISVALLASFWRSRLSARTVLAISWVCGLALIGFGVKLGYSLFAAEIF
jgi:threonine/homoserine/homoserine lactone efflux protein